MEISKLISTILKTKKLQQISQESVGFIIPSSWLRAMGWDRKTKFTLGLNPINKEIIIREIVDEEVSNIEPISN